MNGPVKSLEDTQHGMDGTTKPFFANGNERACDYIEDPYANRTTLNNVLL